MIIDRYTKAVLTLIAISLFVISLNPWIEPTKAYAADDHTVANAVYSVSSAIRRIDCSR